MSGKYYPNNWQEYKDSPDEDFIPHTFEELMAWKVGGWELPSSVSCIIRAHDRKTQRVEEFTYSRIGSARERVRKLLENPDMELTVCDHQAIHFVTKPTDEPTHH